MLPTKSDSRPIGEHRFGDGEPFALGVEEELFLVEPATGVQLNAGPRVSQEIAQPEVGHVAGEVHACQIEAITGVCSNVGEAMGQLSELRERVLATGVGLLGAATHPTADEGDGEISDADRYQLIGDLLGDALATPVAAVHVHVGMPDPETAIRVFNGLRRHVPLLEALAANSPFRHGRDTGLASGREITLRAWPRSGVPREMHDFEDFRAHTDELTRIARVPDYTFHWWKLRPHPWLGTVELRALDVQARPEHTAALVAAVHVLARLEAEADPVPGPPPELLDEASFSAGRSGITATLPDVDGVMRPVVELLEALLDRARPVARELDCADELESLRDLVEQGGGAGLQRMAFERGGIEAVLATTTTRPSSGDAGS